MIERTIIENAPAPHDALLAYVRKGEANAFTYIPDVQFIEVGYFACGHRAIIEVVDQDGFPHSIEVPASFAQSVLKPREWALQRLRRVLCAEWN